MSKKWTNDQQDAIYSKWRNDEKTKSSNILVNAAAGSGKTAVLVERIINKLCSNINSPDHCDVDRLLVVTFTNAAAKEMQQRIADSLSKKHMDAVAENDIIKAEHLKKQLSLLHSADITTIDSFCLNTIKNYFYLIDIDPGFSIIERAQSEMLKDEAIEELFENNYDNEEFISLLSLYADNRDESGLAEIILKIYEFTRSIPNPHDWLDEKAMLLTNCDENSPIFKNIEDNISSQAQKASDFLLCAINYIVNFIYGFKELTHTEAFELLKNNPPDEENELYLTFGTYYAAIYYDYMFYTSLKNISYGQMYEAVNSYEFLSLARAPKIKDKDLLIKDKDILTPIKNFRDEAKSVYNNKIKTELYVSTEDSISILNETFPVVSLLIKYTKLFEEIYNNKKLSKNAMEFSDIEHKCLELFTKHPNVCNELREKYTEILMDEYQDSNALQEEIFKLISRGDNLFMVGDMKQSIYRFRSSEPRLFKSKVDTFKKDKTALNRKIVLSKNFRSRKEVLSSINSVFKAIMTEETGEIDYDEDQQLNFGDESYPENDIGVCGGFKSECYLLLNSKSDENNDTHEKISDVQCEARFIAKKIRELKDKGFLVRDRIKVKKYDENGRVYDTEEIIQRPVQNRDIAILMSSHKRISKIYAEELAALGIESHAQTGGYFDRIEVRLAVALIKTIANPYNDVPLISIMRSAVFGFTDNELCVIRSFDSQHFYEAVKSIAQIPEHKNKMIEKLSKKCSDMLDKISKWQRYCKYMTSDMLLWTLYQETGLYSFCEAVYGEEAGNNLRLLFSRAKAYEKSGYKGIFNFIRYINKLKKREEDLSGAIVFGEESDVVRIMTIHKSKGLEFPVVFVVRNGTEFNIRDTSGHLLLDKDLGFGPDYINYEKSFSFSTIAKNAIINKMKKEIIAEEMRKLYVALTRAKEKLIVTAIARKNTEKFIDNEYRDIHENNFSDVKHFIDWIAPVAKTSDDWHFETVSYSDIVRHYDDRENDEPNRINQCEPLIEISDNEYQFSNSLGIDVKVSVSQLKKGVDISGDYDLVENPEFMKEGKTLTGAERGTAIHYIMQKFNPTTDVTFNDVKEFIEKLCFDEQITREEADSVNPQSIVDFYSSDIGKRILNSPKVVKEAPFEIEVPASEIFDTKSTDTVIVQGIIDCYFYEGDEIVLLDYKSDYYTDIIKIKQKYKTQIDYYSKALEKICKNKVKNKYLYLFLTNSVIEY